MYCIIYLYIITIFAFVTGDRHFDNIKIVNGNNTIIDKHPHMVSIELVNMHICGGSLIKPNMVLTAGHCLDGVEKASHITHNSMLLNKKFKLLLIKREVDHLSRGTADELFILVTTVRVGTASRERGGQTAQVVKMSVHPKYNETDLFLDYDVGVAKLSRSLILHSYVKLIKLQPKGVKVPDKSIGTVAGWGELQERFKDRLIPRILQELKVNKINQEICKVTSIVLVTDRFTCFGSGMESSSACRGDSGGAIVVDGKQVGIVSAALACGLPLFFHNLYTSIENEEIRNYIDQSISEFEK